MVTSLRARRERVELLAEVLDGHRTLDEAPASVRGLATLATRVTEDVTAPTMAAEARDRVRDRVLAEIHLDTLAPVTAPTRTTRSPRTAIATGLASALVAAGGVTVAAQEALPGDALYGLKKATESVREAVVSDPLEVSRLELALARERLDEVTAATGRGDARPSALIVALREMDARTISGVEGLLRVAEIHDEPQLLIDAATFTERQFIDLATLYRELPVTVRPHAEDSLAVLRALRTERIDPAVAACEDCESRLTTASAGTAATDPLISPLPHDTTVASRPSTSDDGPTTSSSAEDADPLQEGEERAERLLDGVRTERSTSDRLVPSLPGPLEDVGDAVDDTLGSLLDGASSLLQDTTSTLESTTEALSGDLEDGIDGLLGD